MKLSILIPVYNEKRTLAQIIEKVLRQKNIDGIDSFELIVVDDASKDGSTEILVHLAKKYPEIRPYFQENNQGKGAAIQKAISLASGDIGIIQDADLEYDPRDYPALLKPILENQADVVYGSRLLKSTSQKAMYNRHTFGNKFLTSLSNWFTELNLTDIETCYKAFPIEMMKTIPLKSKRFGIDPEMTIKFAKRKLRIFEVPISYKGRTYEEGKKITWKDGIVAVYTILKCWAINDSFQENHGYSMSKKN